MKTLNTAPLGGVKLHLNDVLFWQEANKLVFRMLGQLANGNDAFRVNVAVLQSEVSPSEKSHALASFMPGLGFIYARGEFFVAPTASIQGSSSLVPYFAAVQAFEPTGDKLNKAGLPIRFHINTYATLKLSANPSGEADFLALTTIPSLSLASKVTNTITPALNSSQFEQFGPVAKIVLDGNGHVTLFGNVKVVNNVVDNDGPALTTAAIPETHRPPVERTFGISTLMGNRGLLAVAPNGVIRILGANWDSSIPIGDVILLDGINWMTSA